MTDDERWTAVLARDAGYDDVFFYGVLTTGIYCRPSCHARRPLRRNVRFYRRLQDAETDGLRPCRRCHPADPSAHGKEDLMHAMARYISAHAGEKLDLRCLAKQAHMSPGHFQKRFRAALGVSPRSFQQACRLENFKGHLNGDHSVTTAIFETGYSSTSRGYENLNARLGMTPSSYREGGDGETISYAEAGTRLGLVVIAATDRGICFLRFGDTAANLLAELRGEFSQALIEPMPDDSKTPFAQWMQALNAYLEGEAVALDLPADLRGTVFQRLVWDHLLKIPTGEVQSYGEVAREIGKPGAARAVGSACAKNGVAIVVPCHRVIRGDGSLANYRWGLARKRDLIDLERNAASRQAESG